MRILICSLAIALTWCFALPGDSVARGPGDAGHALPASGVHSGGPSPGAERRIDKLEFAAQHPNVAAAVHNANQNSTATNISGLQTNLGGANALGQGAGNTNALLGNGSLTGANSPLYRHAFELLNFLEMARNSTDPNVAARATQILQQLQQHFTQGQTQFNGITPTGLTTGSTRAGGATSTGKTNPPVISHTHSPGQHNSHAGANGHSGGHGSH